MQGRSLIAVFAGLVVLAAVMLVEWRIVVALPAPIALPSPSTTLLRIVAMGLLAEVPAGYLTARLSPSFPFRHAFAVAVSAGLIGGAVMSITGLSTFSLAAGLNLLQAPGILLGAWLQARGEAE